MIVDATAPDRPVQPTDSACAQQQHIACLSRRRALAGVAGVGVVLPVLAACGADEGGTGTSASSSASSAGQSASESASAPPSTEASAESSAPAASGGLTTTADIEVGGGTIFADENVVITQPTVGEFKAFSATCTHQGCAVSSVEDGLIICTCHNSEFSIEDGEPQSGPAESPLEEVALTVTGDQITLA